MSSDFHLDRLPIIIERAPSYGGGCGCGCGGSGGCGSSTPNYGARALGIGWPDWWYSKEAYATCPEYTKIVDDWIKLRAKGVGKFGSIGWFAPKEAKQIVARLQAMEERGDSMVRACKSGTSAGGGGEFAPPGQKEEAGLTPPPADNTLLYAGIAALGLVGLGLVTAAVVRKKKKKVGAA